MWRLSCVDWEESDDVFKIANGGHLEFSNLRILGAAASTVHAGACCLPNLMKSDVPFRSCSCFFVNFKMAVSGHLEFSRMLFLSILACRTC